MKFFNYAPDDEIARQVSERISKVIHDGQFVGGQEVLLFETNFAKYTGSSEVVSCGNGLEALTLALLELDLSQGSRVAVSGHTFFATWLAILNAGFMPVGVDANLEDLQMSPESLRAVLDNENISAVIYVHMHGILGDIQKISELCRDKSVPLIEDCAQAHGLNFEGKHVGTFGNYGAFSFYPTKNLPALGDAGAVISVEKPLQNLRARANYGWMPGDRDKHEILGMNSRLDTLQAGILNVHLQHLDSFNSLRSKIAHRYNEAILDANNIQGINKDSISVWHHFPVRTLDREAFVMFMNSRNVPTQIHYQTPCHQQPAYLKKKPNTNAQESFPNVEEISRTIVSLPMHPWLNDGEVDLVVDALVEWVQTK
jgi:dTDP-4-amino-4,6-dideoxygalactose transaminase